MPGNGVSEPSVKNGRPKGCLKVAIKTWEKLPWYAVWACYSELWRTCRTNSNSKCYILQRPREMRAPGP